MKGGDGRSRLRVQQGNQQAGSSCQYQHDQQTNQGHDAPAWDLPVFRRVFSRRKGTWRARWGFRRHWGGRSNLLLVARWWKCGSMGRDIVYGGTPVL